MPGMHVLISGRVQGVFFRASALEVAEQLGVKGWIRNTVEGNVEAEITGEQQILDRFISWCRKGPSGAVVQSVITTEIPEKQFERFTIQRKS